MAGSSESERSFERIERADLARLAELAKRERKNLVREREHLEPFAGRVLCVALCQGAALHYVDCTVGVKDFDIYTFFAALPGRSGPFNRSPRQRDYGCSKFGRNPNDPDHFEGRRVDLLWRTLSADLGSDPADLISDYLRDAKSGTPWYLAQKAVVLLWPERWIGEVVWPVQQRPREVG